MRLSLTLHTQAHTNKRTFSPHFLRSPFQYHSEVQSAISITIQLKICKNGSSWNQRELSKLPLESYMEAFHEPQCKCRNRDRHFLKANNITSPFFVIALWINFPQFYILKNTFWAHCAHFLSYSVRVPPENCHAKLEIYKIWSISFFVAPKRVFFFSFSVYY